LRDLATICARIDLVFPSPNLEPLIDIARCRQRYASAYSTRRVRSRWCNPASATLPSCHVWRRGTLFDIFLRNKSNVSLAVH
jgi:hypothetical protein